MTISSFCRDQLLAHGPLPLQTLADLAADAGKTTARDPAAAVRTALAYKEIQLADDRWATPLWLLEGRILTVHRLPIVDEWAAPDVDDGYDALLDAGLSLEDPDLADGIDGTHHDLALLDLAARSPAALGRRWPVAQQPLRLRLARPERRLAGASPGTGPAAGTAHTRGTGARRARAGDR